MLHANDFCLFNSQSKFASHSPASVVNIFPGMFRLIIFLGGGGEEVTQRVVMFQSHFKCICKLRFCTSSLRVALQDVGSFHIHQPAVNLSSIWVWAPQVEVAFLCHLHKGGGLYWVWWRAGSRHCRCGDGNYAHYGGNMEPSKTFRSFKKWYLVLWAKCACQGRVPKACLSYWQPGLLNICAASHRNG